MKDGYHLNSFITKDALRERVQLLERENRNLNLELARSGNALSEARADARRLQGKVTDSAALLEELSGQVRTQANIVTSANLAKQEALRQYQVATDRAQELRGELLSCRLALQEAQQQPVSLFDRIFGRDR